MKEANKNIIDIAPSMTLGLNTLANQLKAEGKEVFNLTAGQLPFFPPSSFVESIKESLEEMSSFQYLPVAGNEKLRSKLLDSFSEKREIELSAQSAQFDCIISNGAKQTLANIFRCFLNQMDEVLLMAPYWTSYLELIKTSYATPVVVASTKEQQFCPSIEDLRNAITPKTKMIVLNSPSNPAGLLYPESWLKDLATLLLEYPDILILSDEIYDDLVYESELAPIYPYQLEKSLLQRSFIVGGISKNIASTGLRLGYCIADNRFTKVMQTFQGHSSSNSCALIQNALLKFNFTEIEHFLIPVKEHLSQNASILKKKLKAAGLEECWYPINSAFYFMLDFNHLKRFKDLDMSTDHSVQICNDIVQNCFVIIVPGAAFGLANSARLSIVLEQEKFSLALDRLLEYLTL